MGTKTITALFTILFSISATATTAEDLINKYGKEAIMKEISFKVGKKFTIYVDGATEEAYAPNTDYITASTLLTDIERAGMTVKSVENIFLKRAEHANDEHLQRAVEIAAKKKQEEEDKPRRQALFEKKDKENIAIILERQAKEAAMSPKEKDEIKRRNRYEQELYEKAFGTQQEANEKLNRQQVENQFQEEVRTPSMSINPISEVSRSQAEADLKAELLRKYESSYSLIEMLLNAGMKSYDSLILIPADSVNNNILGGLKKRYYPSFSLIETLYEANKKSHDKLYSQ